MVKRPKCHKLDKRSSADLGKKPAILRCAGLLDLIDLIAKLCLDFLQINAGHVGLDGDNLGSPISDQTAVVPNMGPHEEASQLEPVASLPHGDCSGNFALSSGGVY